MLAKVISLGGLAVFLTTSGFSQDSQEKKTPQEAVKSPAPAKPKYRKSDLWLLNPSSDTSGGMINRPEIQKDLGIGFNPNLPAAKTKAQQKKLYESQARAYFQQRKILESQKELRLNRFMRMQQLQAMGLPHEEMVSHMMEYERLLQNEHSQKIRSTMSKTQLRRQGALLLQARGFFALGANESDFKLLAELLNIEPNPDLFQRFADISERRKKHQSEVNERRKGQPARTPEELQFRIDHAKKIAAPYIKEIQTELSKGQINKIRSLMEDQKFEFGFVDMNNNPVDEKGEPIRPDSKGKQSYVPKGIEPDQANEYEEEL